MKPKFEEDYIPVNLRSSILASKFLCKRSKPRVETFEEEGIMEWEQYVEYFKELSKEDKNRLIHIRNQKLIDINEALRDFSTTMKIKEASKIYGPIEKIMK